MSPRFQRMAVLVALILLIVATVVGGLLRH